jgi:hypothetical protein
MFYNPKLIEEYKIKINKLIEQIKELSNKTTIEYDLAKQEVINENKDKLNKHSELAEEYLNQIKKLKEELEIYERKLYEVQNAEKLSAEKARIAAEEAKKIVNEISNLSNVSNVSYMGGTYDQKLIDGLKLKINEIKKNIIELNKKTNDEYKFAQDEVIKVNKDNLDKHTNLAEDYLNQIKKLQLELEKYIRELRSAEESSDDQFLANNGPAFFPGQNNPNNKFIDNDYVIPTGSSKPEKQKFIGKTGKILNVLEAGIGKNTSQMTRYDVDFGKLGKANFKESRLIPGKKEDYKPNNLLGGGGFYEKYMKYKDKYLRLKSNI